MDNKIREENKKHYVRIGELIRHYRFHAGYDRAEIAELLGISKQQMGKYEHGVDRIPIVALFTLAMKFEIDLNSFAIEAVGERVSCQVRRYRTQTLHAAEIFNDIPEEAVRGALLVLMGSLANVKKEEKDNV
jgi:transcriptional regulator with XRE-family HTH domain